MSTSFKVATLGDANTTLMILRRFLIFKKVDDIYLGKRDPALSGTLRGRNVFYKAKNNSNRNEIIMGEIFSDLGKRQKHFTMVFFFILRKIINPMG